MTEYRSRPRTFTFVRARDHTPPPSRVAIYVDSKVVRVVPASELFSHYLIYTSIADYSKDSEDVDTVDICEDCVKVHQLRTCDGSTSSSFEFCPAHHDAAHKDEDRKLLEKTRSIDKGRITPEEITYKHAEGCLHSDSPECQIQVSGGKLADSIYIKDCSGQYVNARGQILVTSDQNASEEDARLAASCRWIYRRDIVLASRPDHYPIRTIRRMNQGRTGVVSLASDYRQGSILTSSGPRCRFCPRLGMRRS